MLVNVHLSHLAGTFSPRQNVFVCERLHARSLLYRQCYGRESPHHPVCAFARSHCDGEESAGCAAKKPAPLDEKALRSLGAVDPEVPVPQQRPVSIQSFCAPAGTEPRLIKDSIQPDTYHVEVSSPSHSQERPYERIPISMLGADVMAQYANITELNGARPLDAPVHFVPEPSEQDKRQQARRLTKGEDRPTNVFGPDDRVVFRDTTYPWRTTGRIRTVNGTCTGSVIGPRLVLTASHCMDWQDGGGVGWVEFSPGYYNGNGPWGLYRATRTLWWNRAEGGLTDVETAFDYVVLVMDRRIGDDVGYLGYRTYDSAWNGLDVWWHVGYPGDLTSAQRPTYQNNCTISTAEEQLLKGQTGLVLGHFNDTAGGHSGGPVWGWWGDETFPRVVGVQSAAAFSPAMNPSGDNEFGGGAALSALISYARNNYP